MLCVDVIVKAIKKNHLEVHFSKKKCLTKTFFCENIIVCKFIKKYFQAQNLKLSAQNFCRRLCFSNGKRAIFKYCDININVVETTLVELIHLTWD